MSCGKIVAGVFATRGAFEAKVIAVVEAPVDALSLAACGLPAVALFGCSISADRAAMLRRLLAWKTVVIATDNDVAGDRAAAELRAQLTIGTRCERLDFAGCKDANELLLRDRDLLEDRVRRFVAAPEPDSSTSAAALLEYAKEPLALF